ncbi:hypothetical protein N7499_003508 [Penicillium canescens]|uniref:Uncharacterized protein n=1 Tax=Penicillium canescens TaxID=5083 RepID=A0AAD6N7D2_PENCN|nr:uncharacterized protein N7446_012426 [Penicillium canescens]KAJ6020210.1 hypothetical protein N7522_000285 [Penicillium canescens]KAJ6038164.1 hypothetical protein N7460_007935 [Penicillium canescens]KAJ6045562.1 hypothetical protein N7446_012426 [Penicillium canescens]KAJ6061246.1 hypothetical protein N7444_001942 [Penicillium canescens]KAJ6090794.1 hypothetical protein N7499_003508 [Penicillium canescens]
MSSVQQKSTIETLREVMVPGQVFKYDPDDGELKLLHDQPPRSGESQDGEDPIQQMILSMVQNEKLCMQIQIVVDGWREVFMVVGQNRCMKIEFKIVDSYVPAEVPWKASAWGIYPTVSRILSGKPRARG